MTDNNQIHINIKRFNTDNNQFHTNINQFDIDNKKINTGIYQFGTDNNKKQQQQPLTKFHIKNNRSNTDIAHFNSYIGFIEITLSDGMTQLIFFYYGPVPYRITR